MSDQILGWSDVMPDQRFEIIMQTAIQYTFAHMYVCIWLCDMKRCGEVFKVVQPFTAV